MTQPKMLNDRVMKGIQRVMKSFRRQRGHVMSATQIQKIVVSDLNSRSDSIK